MLYPTELRAHDFFDTNKFTENTSFNVKNIIFGHVRNLNKKRSDIFFSILHPIGWYCKRIKGKLSCDIFLLHISIKGTLAE